MKTRPKGAPRSMYRRKVDPDVMISPACVADHHDLDAIKQAQKMSHDFIVNHLGEQRTSGVTWRHYDAGPGLELLPTLFPGEDVAGMVEFLRDHPHGLLVIASAEYIPGKGLPEGAH